jgi:hypothetical protein
MDLFYLARESMICKGEYYALGEETRAQLTFQQFLSIKNPRWSKEEITYWVNKAEENNSMDILDFTRGIVDCDEEYQTLNENLRGLMTFHHFVSYKNPSWSKDEVTHWVGIAEENRAMSARWMEEQRNPTPSRNTQPCHYCKGPWELGHRCRDQRHTIEAHHDSDDEVCEDGAIDVDSEQSDDDSDSCTEASDSDSTSEDSDDDSCTEAGDSDSTSEDSDDDSCTEATDDCTLEEDDDPCVVDRQLDGQDDSTSASTDISHTIDVFMSQQSSDTSEESHVLAPRDDELPMGAMTHLSPVQTPMIATSHEETSGTSGMMDEPIVRDAHHGHVDPQIQEEIQDVQVEDLTHTGQLEEIESHYWRLH